MTLDLLPGTSTAHNFVSLLGFLVNLITCWTVLPKRKTGHRTGSPYLRWVLVLHFSCFFWSSNRIITWIAITRKLGWLWLISFLYLSKKLTPPRQMVMVLPTIFGIVNFHDRMAKKNAPIIKSAMWFSALFSTVPDVCWAMHLSKAGVMAFCDFGLGDTLIIALIRSWMLALNPYLLELSGW